MKHTATCLWFSTDADNAVRFYSTVFPDLSVGDVSHGPDGSALVVEFTLRGQRFLALNGGPTYTLSPAVSIYVPCPDQAEVDRLWAALSDGGTELSCGWLTDTYGLSWQIVPEELPALLTDPDPARAERARQAMMPMRKLDIAVIRDAAART
ncbi:VOC family protein [Saccharomonospora xinjiangensis]|uniref:VOC family protein n=1 Tax=Saccharomonospora xinjiangensis TaxID=75294 RepID=UPI00106F5EE0|nr:VOC family protein [Saccharomonospora xinjiangensis]QBQ60945.1 3-demethylubiquinone-9 3-methyltransferase [Saccharomonospora xinjiangensis]